MADILKTSEPDTLAPTVERQQSLARIQAVPWLMFIAMLALSAWLGWKAFGPSDLGDPLSTSLVAFEKQNTLTVFSAEFASVVASDDSRYLGMVQSRQVAVIPARVDYTLDLSQIGSERLAWNAETHVLDVQLPAIKVGEPNLDEARAQYLREGIWSTRDAQGNLTRKNTQLAEQQAVKQAANPVLLDLARGAAKDAIRQNLAIPLSVAGYGDVSVNVSFDGQP
jgi:hypothetical protein